jgi:3,4-dihydroxy 2-butanone 4-phosphate synthase/GTP cyclohydrolase II
MRMINEAGRGAIVLIRSGNPSVLSARVRSNFSDRESPYLELRDYGTGAQIVLDLGIRDMILLSNTKRTMIAIEGYGLKIVEQRPIKISTDLSSYTMEESHDRA